MTGRLALLLAVACVLLLAMAHAQAMVPRVTRLEYPSDEVLG